MCEWTTNKHIFKEVETTLNQYNLTCNMLDCVTTYDGKICGTEKGQIYKDCENGYRLDYSLIILLYYCIIQSSTLLEMYESIMVNEPVVSTMNLICCHGLSDHHQFHGFLSEIEDEYAYCPIAVWWLSRDKLSLRIFRIGKTEYFFHATTTFSH